MTPEKFLQPVAHRGLHNRDAGIIENSRSAFEAAIDGGFAIECDLQLTSDGQPIVFHDPVLARLTGAEGTVRQTAAAAMQKLPLLDSSNGDAPQHFSELLEQIDGRTLLVVEIKEQANDEDSRVMARAVVAALKNYDGPLVVESFDPRALILAREAGYTGELGIILAKGFTGARRPFDKFVRQNLLHWPATRFSFISCHWGSLSLPMVRLFRSRGLPVTAWTTKSAEEHRTALAAADQVVFEGYDPNLA